MEFTGERYVPEVHGNIELEHIHRYLLACEIAVGKEVLDIACGEGYGAAMLAVKATRVIGIDISAESVDYARRRYPNPNLEFIEGSCLKIPIPNASVDLVVSFETIEHVEEHTQMMAELKRVLRTSGTLLISSPDKYNYSIEPGFANPFHKKELYHHEFEQLVSKYFEKVIFYGQRVGLGSWISSGETQNHSVNYFQENEVVKSVLGIAKPNYWIAIASDLEPPELASSFFEQPIEDSELVRSWRGLVTERDHGILELNRQLEEQERLIQNLIRNIAEKNQSIQAMTTEATERNQTIQSLTNQIGEKDQSIISLAGLIAEKDITIQNLADQIIEKDKSALVSSRQIAEKILEIQILEGQVKALEEELVSYTMSKSWRFTRPFRKISQILQKRKK